MTRGLWAFLTLLCFPLPLQAQTTGNSQQQGQAPSLQPYGESGVLQAGIDGVAFIVPDAKGGYTTFPVLRPGETTASASSLSNGSSNAAGSGARTNDQLAGQAPAAIAPTNVTCQCNCPSCDQGQVSGQAPGQAAQADQGQAPSMEQSPAISDWRNQPAPDEFSRQNQDRRERERTRDNSSSGSSATR